MVSPTDELAIAEVAIRQVIADILSAKFGTDWLLKCGVDEKKLNLWRKRMETEGKARSSALLSRELFDYSQITQLRPIIEQHWDLFERCFMDREKTVFYLCRLEQLRNPPMHGRQLLKFERDLVAGMCGELRNLITKYKTARDGGYYSRIEQVVDSFGNRVPDPTKTLGMDSGSATSCSQVLSVGDVVNYSCSAFDPEDLEVEWQLCTSENGVYGRDPFVDPVVGYNVTLEWQVSDQDVGRGRWIAIFLRTKDVDHRASEFWDGSASFWYEVAPPPGRRFVRQPSKS